MEKELTNLSKSLGLKKIGPLKFKEDDDLYKKFQKLIKYIYKNGEWEQKDNSNAVRKMFEYRFGKEGTLEKLSLDDTSIPQYKQTEDFSGEIYRYNWRNASGQPMATYFFVDPQNKFGSNHGKRFRPFDSFGRQKRTSSQYIYDKEAIMLNQDRLVGFDQLEKALLEEHQKQQGNYIFSEQTLRDYLSLLVDPAMAGKKEVWRFKETNHSYGELVEFIDGYIDSVYEVAVQHEYERNLESQFRADPATTKANINDETQKVMDNTELKQYFKFVELDNEVDLKLFGDFEREMHRVQEVLPKINDTKPDLRLRKLGNYKAAGLYFPFNKTIALDFRSDSTENRDEYKPSEPGIRSFIHEYGHYLDYNLVNSDGMTTSLSLEPEFRPIIEKYVEQLKENGIYSQSHGKTANYYAVPTEVFARAFEVYAYEKGLRSPLMKSEDYGTEPQYVSFTPEIREEITKYFDEKLPEFGGKIRELAGKEKVQDETETEIKGTKKKDYNSNTPSLQPEVEGSGLPVQENSDQKFLRPSVNNSIIIAEQEVGENGEKGTKKEGREYAPYSQSETEGSGLPDQENLIHEFYRPSLFQFNMNLDKKPRQMRGFHVATTEELNRLNRVSDSIKEAAEFYKDNLSNGSVIYVSKHGESIEALRIKYGEENFAHLVGMRFDRKDAKEMLEDLVNGVGEQNAILLKNDGSTFEKIKVLSSVSELIDASVFKLSAVAESVPQARKLRFSEALKTNDKRLLLALKDFEPEFYRPYSLINLESVRNDYSDYSRVPENTVLAVLSETRNELGGLSIGTLSINNDYVKDMSSAMGIVDVMNKRISEEIARSESTEQEQSETKTQEPDTEPQEQNEDPSYQLQRAQGKLERLQEELDQVNKDIQERYEMTNGQPMNDKRNGSSWFKRTNQLEEKRYNKIQELEEQKKRVEMLKRRDHNKANGLNRRGNGLDMSVENIPRIKEEIAKFERGESSYRKETIQRYQSELVRLEEMAKLSGQELTPGAQKLVDEGLIRQWKKKPTLYFVADKEFRRLALELNAKGEFQESSRYPAMYGAAEEKIAELLKIQKDINDQIDEPQDQNEDLSVQRDLETDQVNEAQEPENKVANNPKQEKVSVPYSDKLTAKQIDEAKARDILAVAQNLGIELISDKGNYYWEAEPSFMIDTRSKTFSWKDKNIHRGDTVGLVENVKEITFAESVRYLNDAEIASFNRDKIKYRLNNGQVTSNETQENSPQKKVDTNKETKRGLPKRVTKEQIAAARDRNILEVAQELGMSLQQKGQTYTWTEHDSLVIFPGTNTYSWFSKGENGKNSLDLVQSIKGMDFKTAVMYLNSAELSEFDESKVNLEPQKPFKYLLKDSNDVSKLKEYFVNERKIDGQTVNDFLRSGVIAQANRIYQNQFEPVVVFKHKEASGKLVGASLQGIKEDWQRYPERGRLKEIITNSKRNWGVTYNSGLKADQNSFKMIFFEAPIDMMSYYELHKDKLDGVRLVAMNGLKDNTMGRHIAESFGFAGEPSLKDLNDRFKENGLTRSDVAKRFKAQNVSLKIAVDNDDKGREFIDRLNKKYPLIPFEADLPPLLKGREKTDWNDYLKATKLEPDLVLEYSHIETKKEPDQSQIPLEKKEEPKTIKKDIQKVVSQTQVGSPKEEKKEFDIETASAKELSNFAVKKIREITQDPQMLDEYMTMLGKFPEYSPRNVALIYTQAKDAQMVGTFKEWQARHDTFKLTKDDIMYDEEVAARVQESGREYEQKLSIKSGERGKVNLFKVKQEWKLPRTDETGNVLKFENGNIKYKQYHPSKLTELEKKLIEDKKITPKLLPARDKNGALIFMKYKVFDISQTNLKQESYQKVVGKHQYDYEAEKSKLYKISYALKAYAKENNIDYKIDKLKVDGLDPNVKGKYHDDAKHGPKVRMNKNLEFADSLGTAIRLLSHGVINNIQNTEKEATKSQRGLEAEIMGHAVAAHFGLKTEDRWLKPMTERLQELSDKELSKSLNQVAVESHKFINSIAKYSDTPKRQRDRSMKKKYNHTQTIGRNI